MWYYILGALCLLLSSFFIWFYKRFSARKLKMDGPKHYPFFGSLFEFLENKARMYDWLYECSQKYGKDGVFSVSLPALGPMIFLMKPEQVKYILKDNMQNYNRKPLYEVFDELMGEGMFNIDGEKWKEQRIISSHMFSTKKLKINAFNIFMRSTDNLIKRIDGHIERNEPFDIKDYMFRTTMDSIAKMAFDYDTDCLISEDVPEFTKSVDWAVQYLFNRGNDPLWKIKLWLNVENEQIYKEKVRVLNEVCYHIIEERKKKINDEGYEGDDILSLFMGRGINDPKYLRDMVFTFIIAGRDTTASSLTYFFYEMAKNPDVEKKVRDEIDLVVDDELDFSGESCGQLKYTENSFLETLRLHPPVPFDGKYAENDDWLPDDRKTFVPAGARVSYSPYIFGRLRNLWGDDVLEFKPERWDDVNIRQNELQYHFIAFNAGPRICLGRFFAILEAKVVISRLFKRYRFSLVDEELPKYTVGLTTTARDPVMVRATLL